MGNKITSVVLHITDACSHHCPFCYASEGFRSPTFGDISTLKKIVDRLDQNDVKNLTILGGDPILYPDLTELLKYVFYNTKMMTTIMSNTLANNLRPVSSIAPYIFCIETTLHGPDAETHDKISGRNGSYDFLLQNVNEYLKHEIKIGVAINVTPFSFSSIFETVAAFHKECHNSVSHVIVQRIIPSGMAKSSLQFGLNLEQVEVALNQLCEIEKNLHINISVEDPFPLCSIPKRFWKYMHPCEWGNTKVAINSLGDLSRCGADTRYSLGNLLTSSLEEIWGSAQELLYFRSGQYLSKECQICPVLTQCRGGCPLSSQLNSLTTDYLANFCTLTNGIAFKD